MIIKRAGGGFIFACSYITLAEMIYLHIKFIMFLFFLFYRANKIVHEDEAFVNQFNLSYLHETKSSNLYLSVVVSYNSSYINLHKSQIPLLKQTNT